MSRFIESQTGLPPTIAKFKKDMKRLRRSIAVGLMAIRDNYRDGLGSIPRPVRYPVNIFLILVLWFPTLFVASMTAVVCAILLPFAIWLVVIYYLCVWTKYQLPQMKAQKGNFMDRAHKEMGYTHKVQAYQYGSSRCGRGYRSTYYKKTKL